MLINEFIRRLNLIKNELVKTRPIETELIGREALALVRRRIQSTGKDYANADLGSYSTVQLPAFFYFGKSANNAGENKIKAAAKKGQKVSYKELREFNNRETSFVDLTFTGAMWREMDVRTSQNSVEKSVATIEPRTARSKKVADYNSIRYGNILRLSKDESRMLRIANFDRVVKVFRKYLF
jgi:hypothetical protein